MKFKWVEYSDEHASVVSLFFDDEAVNQTGIDDGFDSYIKYWMNEKDTVYGENFWCKVVFEGNEPIGVIVIGKFDTDKHSISEFVVAPLKRGKGIGTSILLELIDNSSNIIGQEMRTVDAVIYPNNKASQRAFEKAGFEFYSSHPDGDSWYYRYEE